MNDLPDEYARVIDFERKWGHYKFEGAKQGAILHELGLKPVRFYQLVSHIIDLPEAMAYDPVTVGRLRRLRDKRRAERSS